jgi:glutamine phosphoribosylpyrophosphate amidotransferase
MCAVIGLFLRCIDQDLIKRVFHESSIRGLHATGISYVKNNRIHTIKYSIPVSQFEPLNRIEEFVNEDGNLYMIGHCRYSTSDIRYPQPMCDHTNSVFSDHSYSLVHNGVISQELPQNWAKLYKVSTETTNDSELLFHRHDNVFEDWKDASIAAIDLYKEKIIRFYRNGRRPLYYTETETGVIITSTKDIIKRSKINGKTQRTSPGIYYKLIDGKITKHDSGVTVHDLQYE